METDSTIIITSSPPPIPENTVWFRGKKIGSGSFGTVNLAVTSNSSHTLFAVKSVNTKTSTPYQLTSLENEIHILSTLSSPFIITYLSSDYTSSSSSSNTTIHRNLHIEYIPGNLTAADIYNDITESILKRYTWCIVSALRYVHSMGIVHGDVKGRNVLIDSRLRIAKLADFGSAMKDGGSGIVGSGSPLWMAPEVVRGERQGWESDVWSLGCTVIEMVSGKSVWKDEGMVKTMWRIGYSDDLPDGLGELEGVGRDFVEKCLRRDFKKRWSCEDLLKHPFLNGEGVDVGGVGVSPRSVIDWPESEDDEDECDDVEEESMVVCGGGELSVEQRIRKLAAVVGCGSGGIKWESDDDDDEWVAVRGFEEELAAKVGDSDVECSSSGNNYHEEEVINRTTLEQVGETSSEVEPCLECRNGDGNSALGNLTTVPVLKGKQSSSNSSSGKCVVPFRINQLLLLLLMIMLMMYPKLKSNVNLMTSNEPGLFDRYYNVFLSLHRKKQADFHFSSCSKSHKQFCRIHPHYREKKTKINSNNNLIIYVTRLTIYFGEINLYKQF